MKKYLLSTIVLAGIITVAAPQVTSAEEAKRDQKTEVEIKFKATDNEFDGTAAGNLILGATPTDISFTGQGGKGFKAPLKGEVASFMSDKYDNTRYVVVNDDRPDAAKPKWTVKAKLDPLTEVGGGANAAKLAANLTLQTQDIKEYHIGAYDESTLDYVKNNPNKATDTTTPSISDIIKDYSGDTVRSSATNNILKLEADGTSVSVMERVDDNADTKHSNQNELGTKKGGQGYALLFNKPVLEVKSGAIEGKSFKSDLTWELSFDDSTK